jgi:hypothetical protein
MNRKTRLVFKAAWSIRIAVLAALVVWTVVAVIALIGHDLPASTRATALFFVAFFIGFSAYYWCMTYVVDEYGLTYRGATDFLHIPWEDVLQVRDSQIPLGGWVVTTRRGGLVLSNFVRGHDRLREVIVARAGLFSES